MPGSLARARQYPCGVRGRADQQADARRDQEGGPLSPPLGSLSRKRSVSVTLPYPPLPKDRDMSVASTTPVDGIGLGRAVSVRSRRLRLLPYALLAPSLVFLALFTYLPV